MLLYSQLALSTLHFCKLNTWLAAVYKLLIEILYYLCQFIHNVDK